MFFSDCRVTYRAHALAIAQHASPQCRLFVFANPAFSLAKLMVETAPELAHRILVGTKLDENRFAVILLPFLIVRAKTQLFDKVSSNPYSNLSRELSEDVEPLYVIGNHSHATFIDYSQALFLPSGKPVTDALDLEWLNNDVWFLQSF